MNTKHAQVRIIMSPFVIAVMLTGLSAVSQTALASSFQIEGDVISVADGDTVTILDKENNHHKIRLAQIDAPEISHGKSNPGQPYGQKSKQSLSELVFRKHVVADCLTTDRYGRSVCKIEVGTMDANLEQVKRGMAWLYVQYAHDQAYFDAESTARVAKAGLWADAHPTPPWEYRHAQK